EVSIVVATAIWRSLLDNVIVWAGLDDKDSPISSSYSAGEGSPEDFQMKSKADVILEAEKVSKVEGTTVMVGDSPFDIKAAKEAGVFCVGVAKDPAKRLALAKAGVDVLITDYASALPQLLEWLNISTDTKLHTKEILSKVVLFDGNEVLAKPGGFSDTYLAKRAEEIFVVGARSPKQIEDIKGELRSIGLNPDSDDLKVGVLKGPALEDYDAMLGAAEVNEVFGSFKIIRGGDIDEKLRNLREAIIQI
ncbi:MAG: HAD hydrolase-like protein, partial [Candidatus Omnitrophica bacterium]|nr:HAD hydrolase-like protein [Candidatus Omnitrophota bacterium]